MTAQAPAQPKPRIRLGRQSPADLALTVLRIVGKHSKTPALDVAAFQSFAD